MKGEESIRIVATPRDRSILTDPAVQYRPTQIKGKRYTIRAEAPQPRKPRDQG
jgi:hypothetical protein